MLLVGRIRRLVLLVRQTTLSIGALRIALTVHLGAWILRCAIDLLRLRILGRRLASWLISDWWQLWSAHLVRHHAGLAILSRGALLLRWVVPVPSSFLALSFLFLLALILFFLLAGFPLLSYLYSSVSVPSVCSHRYGGSSL